MQDDLISRSWLVSQHCAVNCGCTRSECGFTQEEDGTDCCSYVKEIESAPSVEAEPKWISVKERLPERHGQLVVGLYNQHGADKSFLFPYIFTWHAYGENGYVKGPHFSDEGLDGLKVWYWMPLPEMPKEEET